jgi:hypothetical protein
MKLNREFLLTEKPNKKKLPVFSESWVRPILISNIGRNEVNQLGHSPGLIDSTGHSHTEEAEETGRAME